MSTCRKLKDISTFNSDAYEVCIKVILNNIHKYKCSTRILLKTIGYILIVFTTNLFQLKASNDWLNKNMT